MSSAAKRVGFNRVSDGTPRSKKEGPIKQSKALIFPDKVRLDLISSETSWSKVIHFSALAIVVLESQSQS